jgi:putative PIN family toxin of toxin-antitoxin system
MNYARKKLVFDTSSLIPICLHPDREPAQIFKRATFHHDLFASSETIAELMEVLSRSKFDAWRSANQRMAWGMLYQSMVTVVDSMVKIEDCRDVKDNKFLEVAVSAQADILISSDIHLLELHPYRNMEILKLKDFGERFF